MRRFFGRIVSVFDNPAGLTIGRLISSSLSLVSAPIIAQAIGAEGRGYTAAAIALVVVTGVIIGMGVPLAIRRRAVDNPALRDLVVTGRVFALFTVIPTTLIGLIALPTVLSSLPPSDTVAFLIAMALSSLAVSWGSDIQVLLAWKQYWRMMWVGSIQTVTYFVVVVCAWLLNSLSVSTVLYAFSAGGVAAFLLGRIWVPSRGGKITEMRELLREGLHLWGSQAAQVASARVDQFLVLPIIGAGATGIYSVGVTIGALPVTIGIGLGAAVFQGFVRNSDPKLVARGVRMSIVVATVSAIAIAIVSIWIVPWLFGPEFADSVQVAWVVLLGSIAVVAATICSMAFVARRRGVRMTVIQLIGLAVALASMVPLGLWLGAIGAAAASTVGYFVALALSVRHLGLRTRDVIPGPSDVGPSFRVFLGRGD